MAGPAIDVRDWVTPEDLNVAPDLLGLPLARPWRRAAAMAVDLCAIGILSALGNAWMLLGIALAALAWAHMQRRARTARELWPAWCAAGLLVAAGIWQTATEPRTAAQDDAATRAEVAQALEQARSAARSAGAGSAASAPAAGEAVESAIKLAALEAQSKALRQREAPGWRDTLREWVDEYGPGYGWSMLYFTWLTSWWRGQTLGKRLFGLRVVELSGKPMTMMRCLKRYGGYAAGMATGGLGIAQLWWDANRQGLQDRTAHTVVIDLRNPRRLDAVQWPALAAAAQDAAAAGGDAALSAASSPTTSPR